MLALGTPFYKIKHDFKPSFQNISEVTEDEEDKKFYSEKDWKTLQEWKLKVKKKNEEQKENSAKPEDKAE